MKQGQRRLQVSDWKTGEKGEIACFEQYLIFLTMFSEVLNSRLITNPLIYTPVLSLIRMVVPGQLVSNPQTLTLCCDLDPGPI